MSAMHLPNAASTTGTAGTAVLPVLLLFGNVPETHANAHVRGAIDVQISWHLCSMAAKHAHASKCLVVQLGLGGQQQMINLI